MPVLVPVEEIQPGMRLVEPIVSRGRIMLQSHKALTAQDLSVLKRRYPGLCVRVSDPVLDDVIDFEDDSQDRNIASETQQKIAESMSEVRERFSERASLGGAQLGAIQEAVNEIMLYFQGHPNTAALLSRSLDPSHHLSTHTGNVFYLSMLLGSMVKGYVAAERKRQTSARNLRPSVALDLTPLGLGSFFMDLGMIPLQNLLENDHPLTELDRRAIQNHPNAGANTLPERFSAAAKMIVRTHHENFDGTGYPKGMPGEKLHVFSRIVRIADAFDSATADRVYKKAKSPARALWEMSVGPSPFLRSGADEGVQPTHPTLPHRLQASIGGRSICGGHPVQPLETVQAQHRHFLRSTRQPFAQIPDGRAFVSRR